MRFGRRNGSASASTSPWAAAGPGADRGSLRSTPPGDSSSSAPAGPRRHGRSGPARRSSARARAGKGWSPTRTRSMRCASSSAGSSSRSRRWARCARTPRSPTLSRSSAPTTHQALPMRFARAAATSSSHGSPDSTTTTPRDGGCATTTAGPWRSCSRAAIARGRPGATRTAWPRACRRTDLPDRSWTITRSRTSPRPRPSTAPGSWRRCRRWPRRARTSRDGPCARPRPSPGSASTSPWASTPCAVPRMVSTSRA